MAKNIKFCLREIGCEGKMNWLDIESSGGFWVHDDKLSGPQKIRRFLDHFSNWNVS